MTIPRWLNSPLCTRSELRPGRALLTPTWLAALALLGINDHLLKGAGVLPGALTGKLSDLAGMVVAPALLAALLGLRTRRGLLFCHLAVGAVFAAIKVSPAAADAWSWLMGLVGNAWIITVDPTDLIALPMLALGWRALVPAMARPLPGFKPGLAPRFAQIAAIVTGTSLSVATSDSDDGGGDDQGEADVGEVGDWDTGWETGTEYVDIDADAYIHNGSDADIIIRTRDLLEEVQLDCSAVSDDPGLLLSQPLFGEGRTWTMPPSTNAAARNINLRNRECYAVMVEGDRLRAPFVLFWRASELDVQVVPGDIDDPSQHRPGGVLLAADADGELSVESSQRPIVYDIDLFPAADAYYPGPDVERLAWSDAPSTGQAMQITALDVGPDGCLALEFDDGAALPRWYLCLPADSFPFAATEWVTVDVLADGDMLELSRVAGPQDPEPPPATVMVVSRGPTLPQLSDTAMAGKAVFDIELAPEETCGTVARPTELSVRYGEGAVQSALPGDTLVLEGANTTLSLWVAHAEERVVLNPTCAEGPDVLGADYEIVAVRAPIAP